MPKPVPVPARVVCDVNGYYAGAWTVTVTPATVTFELVERPHGGGEYWVPDYSKLVCRRNNKCPHALCEWGDGCFTVYPNRSGTPYYFQPAPPPVPAPAPKRVGPFDFGEE